MIGERACWTSKNHDHKGGEEANATEGSCFGNAQALQVATLGTATKQLMESEASAEIDEGQFRKEANELQKQREARGKEAFFL